MSSFHGLFWGIALIIIGMGLMSRFYYDFYFPWLSILGALVLIYVGLILIFRPRNFLIDASTILFGDGVLIYTETHQEYKVIFGSGTIDLTQVGVNTTKSIEIIGVFAEVKILLGSDTNYMIRSDAAFASFSNPDGSSVSFGSLYYKPPHFDPNKPYLNIKANVVFGNMRATHY
ncbi:MAG: hypothetical protein IH597_06530 [Bacteroidales bacterium]|nr:hypothetical protein [Bacteroidales bacterium]